jgi:two-component system, cell cycle sensor histidine kinase PleC
LSDIRNPLAMAKKASRILWFGAAAFCAVATLAFGFAANWVHERERDFRVASVERSLAAAGEHATQLFARMDAALLAALADFGGRTLEEIDDAELDGIRAQALAGAPFQLRLQFWDATGQGRGEFQRVSVTDRDYFLFHMPERLPDPDRSRMLHASTGMLVGVPVLSRDTGAWTLPVSRAIQDRQGNFAGVVSAAFPIDTFLDLYAGMRDAPSDLLALWRNDRTMLVRAPFDVTLQSRRFENAPVWQHYPAARSGRYEAPTVTDGVTRLVMFRGLEPLPLVLVYAIERRTLAYDALRTYWPLLAVALAAILVAILYAFLSARYAARLGRSLVELQMAQIQTRLAAEARGRFIATMNHELRTPLNAIIGFAEVMSSEIYGKLGAPKYKEYAGDIRESGSHLLSLIDDVIDFSAVDLGRRQLARERAELADIARSAARLLQPQAQAQGIKIEISGDLPAVLGDARAIRQIATNLLSNAVKFSPPGGAVRVRAASPHDGRVGIAIVDEGPGIPPDEIGRVGEPFFRGRDAERHAIGGTGLGVGISRALAKQMDGAVELEVPPAGGTIASLMLPPAA